MENVIFSEMNENNKEELYWIYRIGLLKFDLDSCMKIVNNLKENSIYESIYLSKLLYVHLNEGYHLLHDLKMKREYSKFIDEIIISSDFFIRVMKEVDFGDIQSDNNKFMKGFRSDIIHYKNDDKNDKNKFWNVLKKIKKLNTEEFQNIFDYSYNLEMTAQMIQLNINFIELGFKQDNYAKVLFSKVNDLVNVCNGIIKIFINNHQ
ncbi:hypothetical protein [Clostridium sp.]